MTHPIFRRRIGFRQDPEDPTTVVGPTTDAAAFEPSLADVLVTKTMLQRVHNRRIPLEIIDDVMDYAGYWPHSTTAVDYLALNGRPLITASHQGGKTGREFILRTPPIGLFHPPPGTPSEPPDQAYTTARPVPRLLGNGERDCPPDMARKWAGGSSKGKEKETEEPSTTTASSVWPSLANPVRKIVFHIKSHDQGWTTDANVVRGGYQGSHSWFDVGHERYVHEGNTEETGPTKPGDEDDDNDDNDTLPRTDANTVRRTRYQRFPTTAVVTSAAATPPTPPAVATIRSLVPAVRLVEHPNAVRVTGAPGFQRIIRLPWAPSPDDPPLLPSPRPDADGNVQYPTTERISEKVPEFDLPAVEMPGPHRLQANRVAIRQWTEHTVVWSWTDDADAQDDHDKAALEKQGRGAATGDGSFVRQLRAGDIVTVWAKAVFAGWHNDVANVTVKVYWAV